MRPSALLYCYLRYGAGHWVRTVSLARALAADGFDAAVAVSGEVPASLAPPEGIAVDTVPLPPDDFSGSATGAISLGAALSSLVDRRQPSVFIVESFPFGRQDLAIDMARCLRHCRALPDGPIVISSVRDIQQRRLPRQDWLDRVGVDFTNRYVDAVLAHTDPALAPFAMTFPLTGQLKVPVYETGYLDTTGAVDAGADRDPVVVVSAGGGRAGLDLLFASMAAQREGAIPAHLSMHVYAGALIDEAAWQSLQAAAAGVPRLELRRWSRDLRAELARAAVSVSQCGYNTALDLLAARVPAVVVPYETPHEDEQPRRASLLAARGLVRVVAQTALTPDALGAAIARAAESSRPPASGVAVDDGRRSAAAVRGLITARRAARAGA